MVIVMKIVIYSCPTKVVSASTPALNGGEQLRSIHVYDCGFVFTCLFFIDYTGDNDCDDVTKLNNSHKQDDENA